jgi:hypothetical protein
VRKRIAWGRYPIEDKRDRQFAVAVKSSELTRKMWPDTNWEGDQAATPRCVGYAWAHWLDASPISQFANPDGIYELAQAIDEWEGTDYEGTSVRAGAKVLERIGFIARYEWAFDVEQIIETLLQVGPVVVGTEWLSGMMKPDCRGLIRARGRSAGGHAYLLSGGDRQQGLVRLKNSWGLRWGVKGRAYLPLEDLGQLLSRQGEACLGIEARPTPSTPTTQTLRNRKA